MGLVVKTRSNGEEGAFFGFVPYFKYNIWKLTVKLYSLSCFRYDWKSP